MLEALGSIPKTLETKIKQQKLLKGTSPKKVLKLPINIKKGVQIYLSKKGKMKRQRIFPSSTRMAKMKKMKPKRQRIRPYCTWNSYIGVGKMVTTLWELYWNSYPSMSREDWFRDSRRRPKSEDAKIPSIKQHSTPASNCHVHSHILLAISGLHSNTQYSVNCHVNSCYTVLLRE